jgi:alkaline phosphatase
MGGGKNGLVSPMDYKPNPWLCTRKDGRNLIEEYKYDKEKRGLKYSVAFNNKDLKNLDTNNIDYLLGR